jgi:PAS domain S-box-containing protein
MKLDSQIECNENYCPQAPKCNKGVWEWNINENKIICSPKWKRIFNPGAEPQNCLEEWLIKIEGNSALKIRAGLKEIVEGKINSFTSIYPYKDNGELKYFKHHSEVAEKDNANKAVRIVGVEEDVTTRQLIEEKFQETNHRFAMLMQSLNGGVLVENTLGEIIFVNKKFCELFELKLEPELLIGANYIQELKQSYELFRNPEKFFAGIEETLLLGVPESGFKIELKNKQVLERDFIPLIFDNQLRGNLWFYKDITKFTQIERSLTFRLRFEELLTNLSFNFIRLNDENIDRAIEKALEQIGKFIRVDRSYLYLFSNNNKEMSLTNEWCNESMESRKNEFQKIDTSTFQWWMQKLLRFETILISSVPDMPQQALSEKELLMKQGVKSLIAVPMVYGNQLFGFIGFDSVNHYRRGDQESTKLLKMASSMIISAIKRRENEEALTKSEHKYRSVVNSIHEIIFQTDATGNWTFLNTAWTNICGFSLEESIGQNFLQYVHPDDRQRNLELFKPLIERKKDHCNHEIRYITKDGGFKWIEVYAVLSLNERDEIIGTSGILRDITSRRRSESEINRLNQAVETNPTAVMLTDITGKIIYVNQSLAKISGHNRTDLLGKYSSEFMDENSKSILINEIRPYLINKLDWRGEMNLLKEDGTIFPAEVVCSVVNDGEGNAEYYLVNLNDITKRKKAEEDIKTSLKKEKDLNELKSKFVSFVSHEFRTPLTAILSSAEMLEMYGGQLDDAKKQNHYTNIKKSIDNLIVLLNDVTEINRADSGKIKVNPEEFELVNFLTELEKELYVSYPEHPEIIWEIPFQNLNVVLDQKLFRQLTSNLISNAIKYTPNDKKVYIILNQESDHFSIIVKDEGIGISEEDQKNIFEPFIRGRNVAKIKGTGLGLAILKRAVNLLQGTITLESKVNEGTTLSVFLPQKIESMYRTRM